MLQYIFMYSCYIIHVTYPYVFMITWGRVDSVEGETLSRRVVSTQCVEGLNNTH